MSVVSTIKSLLGAGSTGEHQYRCTECGTDFGAYTDPGSAWLSCPDCDATSDDIEVRDE